MSADPEESRSLSQAAAPPIPRIRTLDALIARANGGEYAHEMPLIIETFFGNLFNFAIDNEIDATGKLTVTLKATVDRFGEVVFDVKPKIELPSPPSKEGKGRAYIDTDGTLVTHPQKEAGFLRDVGPADRSPKDIKR